MLVLPSASPEPPVMAEASKDALRAISMKSTFDQLFDEPLLVNVREVPTALDWTNKRLVALLPLRFNVLVTVIELERTKESVFTVVPVLVKASKVLPPTILATPLPDITRPIPLKFAPPPLKVAVAPEHVTTAVFDVIVSPVIVAIFQTVVEAPVIVIVLAPKVSVRVLELLELNSPHEQVWLLVFSVPLVRVTVPVLAREIALLSDHEPPAPLNVCPPTFFEP